MSDRGGIRWKAVALGWAAAVAAGIVIRPLLRIAYELARLGLSVVPDRWVRGRQDGGLRGGRNGAMTAVCGLAVGVALALILSSRGLLFTEGVALPPAGFGVAGGALLTGLVLFLVDLFGGCGGGKLGEPSRPAVGRYRQRPRTVDGPSCKQTPGTRNRRSSVARTDAPRPRRRGALLGSRLALPFRT